MKGSKNLLFFVFYLFFIESLFLSCSSDIYVSLVQNGFKNSNDKKEESTIPKNQTLFLYVATQSDSSTSSLFKFEYNSSTRALDFDDFLDISEFNDDIVRSLAFYDGNVYVGGSDSTNTATLAVISHPDFLQQPKVSTNLASSVRGVSHGLCFLDNGHFVLGGYNQEITEYSGANTSVATSDTSGVIDINSLSACSQGADINELYIIDYDGSNDLDGDIVYLTKTGNNWNETQRFDLSSAIGSGSLYAMVKHSNGNLYAFAQNLGLALKKPVVCSDIDSNKLSSCTIATGS